MFTARNRRTLFRSGAAALITSAALVLGGCGTDVGDMQNDPCGDGIYDDFARIQSFEGQQVKVTADVVQIVGPNAFTIADYRGTQLLVVHREAAPNVAVNCLVQVTGTANKAFQVAAAEQLARVDLDDASFGAFTGDPYILASNIDATGR